MYLDDVPKKASSTEYEGRSLADVKMFLFKVDLRLMNNGLACEGCVLLLYSKLCAMRRAYKLNVMHHRLDACIREFLLRDVIL